ncbi:hypothetical protein OAE71_01370 [Synechococcus sp. AH-551-A21]|nr:hypothetical protein [Synechococcus sp. AH-551-A21]MDB4677793.1 hypothetical protein [Synechococcus sp. AH-551-A21]
MSTVVRVAIDFSGRWMELEGMRQARCVPWGSGNCGLIEMTIGVVVCGSRSVNADD